MTLNGRWIMLGQVEESTREQAIAEMAPLLRAAVLAAEEAVERKAEGAMARAASLATKVEKLAARVAAAGAAAPAAEVRRAAAAAELGALREMRSLKELRARNGTDARATSHQRPVPLSHPASSCPLSPTALPSSDDSDTISDMTGGKRDTGLSQESLPRVCVSALVTGATPARRELFRVGR
eukprot:1180521-Prorocentrum_minimum.AAC.1